MTHQATNQLLKVLGPNLRAAREAKELSQHELALMVGSQGFEVGRWEKGKHRPHDATLVALAEALGVTVAWLLTDHEKAAA